MDGSKNENSKEFVCSNPIFNGYRCRIDLNFCDNIDDITKMIKEVLTEVLTLNNFENLLHKLKSSKLAIVNHTFEEILIAGPDEIFIVTIN